MATVVSGSQALRLGSIQIGEEFDPSSVYSSGTSAYFLLPNGYSALSGAAFSENGSGVVPTLGTVTGWAKYGYDGTEHYRFSGLNMSVEDWAAAVEENDTTGLLTAALSGPDVITGGALADELWGFDGNDVLNGNAGNDTLRGDEGNDQMLGGAGADLMTGGVGNDTYDVDNAGDRVIEDEAGGDADLVLSSVTHILAANVENLRLNGGGAINGTGNELVNELIGNSDANVLNGGAGIDTMTGGDGNDTYVVDRLGETVTEADGEGTDAVLSSVEYELDDYVENLTLTGTAAINGTGNAGDNRLTGNIAANTLDGRAGNDTMAGGAGNDVYVVDDEDDTVTEAANAGTDTVQSAVAFTLGANVENLTLTGAGNVNGTGNTLANILIGNTGVNTLNGGIGADRMFGGGGNDSYVVDNVGDRIIEAPAAGTDSVTSTVSHTLGANVENLTLGGTAAINGTGNAADNTLTGNSAANVLTGGDGIDTLRGEAGNDTLRGDANSDRLDGGLGADVMIGGEGDDTYVVNNAGDRVSEAAGAAAGEDTVESWITHTLATNVENLELAGDAAINGTGNALANILTGNDKANVLNGGAEADTMAGGGDSDTYIVDHVDDEVVEDADEGGADTVQSSATSFTLSANVENLTLTGTAEIDGDGNGSGNILVGNAAANDLYGHGGDDTLRGNAGNDTLNGGAGADSMTGGTGDDTYTVDDEGDTVTEAGGGGSDTVKSSIEYTLGADVENLELTGAGDIDGTGNAGDNTITGNTGDNTLAGGGGADIFVFAPGFGADTISDWLAGDKISLDTDLGPVNFAALDTDTSSSLDDADDLVAISGGDTVITFAGGDVLTIDATTGLDTDDFLFV